MEKQLRENEQEVSVLKSKLSEASSGLLRHQQVLAERTEERNCLKVLLSTYKTK